MGFQGNKKFSKKADPQYREQKRRLRAIEEREEKEEKEYIRNLVKYGEIIQEMDEV